MRGKFEAAKREQDLLKLGEAVIHSLELDDTYGYSWAQDCKRPFGNSGMTQVCSDILEDVLGEKPADRREGFSGDRLAYAESLLMEVGPFLRKRCSLVLRVSENRTQTEE